MFIKKIFNSKLIFRNTFYLSYFWISDLMEILRKQSYKPNIIQQPNVQQSSSVASKEASACREKKRGKSMRHTCKLLSWRNRSVHVPSNEKLNLAGFRSELVPPNPIRFFQVEPNFGPEIRVESGRVGLKQGSNSGSTL